MPSPCTPRAVSRSCTRNIIRITGTRTIDGKTSRETAYLITSLPAAHAQPADLQTAADSYTDVGSYGRVVAVAARTDASHSLGPGRAGTRDMPSSAGSRHRRSPCGLGGCGACRSAVVRSRTATTEGFLAATRSSIRRGGRPPGPTHSERWNIRTSPAQEPYGI
jgi:hypothetical protein